MSRWTAYRQVGLVGALGALVWAACTPVGPGVEPPTPSPTPVPPVVTPSPAPASPTPAAAVTATPVTIDYDYDYVPPATPVNDPPAEQGSPLISVVQAADGSDYLVGPDGMTLYIFTQDQPGASNCTGSCAQNWPPLIVESVDELTGVDELAGLMSVTERGDGAQQVAYDGMPLYYYVADQVPGDTTGHEVGGVWFLARP
jgi:predicted lipoprotein with Yx(FWY)xxD motif